MKLVIVLILGALAAAAVSVAFDRRRMRENAKALGLDAPGVRVIDCPGPMFRFAVKPEEGIAWVISGLKVPPVSIPLEDIAGCEFLDGGRRPYGLGGALVGEAAASALSGKGQPGVLRILRKDPEQKAVEFRLDRPSYSEDFRIFAKEVSALLEELGHGSSAQPQ